jgi:signal transduction histidine kinase
MTEKYKLLVLAETDERGRELRETLLAHLPSASVTLGEAEALDTNVLTATHGAVVDAGRTSRRALDAFRTLRARGFHGRVALVTEMPDDQAAQQSVNALGNAVCLSQATVTSQPVRLVEAVVGDGQSAATHSTAMIELTRTRRAIAAGELALRLQHDINNPLAGLLAEVQLLQLEELTTEQRAATDRMLELCRRIVGLVRRLDALVDRPETPKV